MSHGRGLWHIWGNAQTLARGWVELREKIWAKYTKCGPGGLMGSCWRGPGRARTPLGALLWGQGLRGAWGLGPGEAEQLCCAARRTVGKVGREEGPRAYLLTQPGGIQHQGFAEGSTQQVGAGACGVRLPRSQGAEAGCKARGRKPGYRARVRTKRKPPNLVSEMSVDEAIPTPESGTRGEDRPPWQAALGAGRAPGTSRVSQP